VHALSLHVGSVAVTAQEDRFATLPSIPLNNNNPPTLPARSLSSQRFGTLASLSVAGGHEQLILPVGI